MSRRKKEKSPQMKKTLCNCKKKRRIKNREKFQIIQTTARDIDNKIKKNVYIEILATDYWTQMRVVK